MKLADVEARLSDLDLDAGQDLIFELLSAYGIPQASITKLRSGTYNRSGDDDTVLWKRKLWDIYVGDVTEEELLAILDRAQANAAIRSLKPRFYIARSLNRLVAVDARTGQTLDIPLTDLARHAAFFMPWAGAEQVRNETASYVDTKVAQQMAKLYDEILATSPDLPTDEEGRRNLNLFFSRLLFCFFSEDTGVFPDGIFTNAITTLTAADGSDVATFLDQLFVVLDTPYDQRDGVPAHFEEFGYVNGSLFTDRIHTPALSRKARNIVVDCGTLDWSSINPDIFGSMIQAVTAGKNRANLGMHYTSVENILKVLNPLFLDDLGERYEDAEDSVKKLTALLDYLGEIKVFDPACGSGNFLIVGYKRLRALEHLVLQRLVDLQGGEAPLFADSRISLENFYGIEVDDFAHDIAKLSLWFAKHQMNQEYDDLFGIERPLIPLTETGVIHCGNATRLNWAQVCEPSGAAFVCGNPPYLGSKYFEQQHKDDFAAFFGASSYEKRMDYISLWLLKAAEWLDDGAHAAFVATNSICQGQHVGMLWPSIFEYGVRISFAHTTFSWSNAAQGNAGVSCVVVGLTESSNQVQAVLFDSGRRREVKNINPYLLESADNTIVQKRSVPFLAHLPKMVKGSEATDGGNLVMSRDAGNRMRAEDERSARFIRPYLGASELLNGTERSCIWIEDADLPEALEVGPVKKQIEKVRDWRSNSKSRNPQSYADRPHRFAFRSAEDSTFLAVPVVSSERREYIPMALLPASTIISNKVFAVYDVEPWLFSILHSKLHMSWVEAVCGRMRSDYNYSNTLGYNTFPLPKMNSTRREQMNGSTFAILAARERWADRSLAELYDPDKMPANLRVAHDANDALVDSLYRSKPFTSDADRMELLLAMYRDLVAEADGEKSKKG